MQQKAIRTYWIGSFLAVWEAFVLFMFGMDSQLLSNLALHALCRANSSYLYVCFGQLSYHLSYTAD